MWRSSAPPQPYGLPVLHVPAARRAANAAAQSRLLFSSPPHSPPPACPAPLEDFPSADLPSADLPLSLASSLSLRLPPSYSDSPSPSLSPSPAPSLLSRVGHVNSTAPLPFTTWDATNQHDFKTCVTDLPCTHQNFEDGCECAQCGGSDRLQSPHFSQSDSAAELQVTCTVLITLIITVTLITRL
eukprot:COSAG03_NODE_166_length_11291_cov_15.762866_10_plen_185_part_00